MSSSRSDVVTQSVRPFARPFVMKEFFFSLRSYTKVFQGSLMGVLMKYQECFMQVSWIGSFKGVSRKFYESFKGVLRELRGSFKGVSKKF